MKCDYVYGSKSTTHEKTYKYYDLQSSTWRTKKKKKKEKLEKGREEKKKEEEEKEQDQEEEEEEERKGAQGKEETEAELFDWLTVEPIDRRCL